MGRNQPQGDTVTGEQTAPFDDDKVPGGTEAVVTSDGELVTSSTERERNVAARFQETGVSATVWRGLIDLSDSRDNDGAYPHRFTGRIDLSSIFVFVDAANAEGSVEIGVVKSIDATSADIDMLTAVLFREVGGFSGTIDRAIHVAPSQLKLGIDDNGDPTRYITNTTRTGVTDVNTATTLAAPSDFVPDVGDIVIRFGWTSGSYAGTVSALYHAEPTL